MEQGKSCCGTKAKKMYLLLTAILPEYQVLCMAMPMGETERERRGLPQVCASYVDIKTNLAETDTTVHPRAALGSSEAYPLVHQTLGTPHARCSTPE